MSWRPHYVLREFKPAPAPRWYYDFDGIGAFIAVNVTYLLGDTLELCFVAEGVPSNKYAVYVAPSGAYAYRLRLNSNNTVQLNGCTATLDGSPWASNDPWPFDGNKHKVVLTFTGADTITYIGTQSDGVGQLRFVDDVLFNIKINDGSVYDYPINDGPLAGGVIANSGTGGNATLINENTADWYEALV